VPRAALAMAATVLIAGAAAADPGEAQFVDYYASASSLIATLNGIAADIERLSLRTGGFSDDALDDVKSRLVKAREGFDAILVFDRETDEINEGYILYIDKVLLALLVAKEYRDAGGPERRERVDTLLKESGDLRSRLNQQVQRLKKQYGVH
jgi:hypothetical protein